MIHEHSSTLVNTISCRHWVHQILVFREYVSLSIVRQYTCNLVHVSQLHGYSRIWDRWHRYCTWISVLLNTVIACNCGYIIGILYCTDIIISIISHCYVDTVIHGTIISYSCPTDRRIHYFTRYRHFKYLYHRYMVYTVISYSYITVTCIHWYTCIDYFYILVVWIIVHITSIIATWILLHSCYMIVSRYLYWYSCYWICELLICDVRN